MNVSLALWEPGMGQIILILVVVLVLFGAKKLPELARGFGQGIKEFKKATRETTEEFHRATKEDDEPPKALKSDEKKDDKPQGPDAAA